MCKLICKRKVMNFCTVVLSVPMSRLSSSVFPWVGIWIFWDEGKVEERSLLSKDQYLTNSLFAAVLVYFPCVSQIKWVGVVCRHRQIECVRLSKFTITQCFLFHTNSPVGHDCRFLGIGFISVFICFPHFYMINRRRGDCSY